VIDDELVGVDLPAGVGGEDNHKSIWGRKVGGWYERINYLNWLSKVSSLSLNFGD